MRKMSATQITPAWFIVGIKQESREPELIETQTVKLNKLCATKRRGQADRGPVQCLVTTRVYKYELAAGCVNPYFLLVCVFVIIILIFSVSVFLSAFVSSCLLSLVLHVSLWLGELLPGQQCINHRFYRVSGCDFSLLAPHTDVTCGPPGEGRRFVFTLGSARICAGGKKILVSRSE